MFHNLILITITLSIAGTFLPQKNLINPIIISDDSMLHNSRSVFRRRDIIKCILSEKIVPKNEYWCISLIRKVVVPFL